MARSRANYEEEINDWARRMIDQVESFDFAETAGEWEGYLVDQGITNPKQLQALDRGRDAVQQFQADIGLRQVEVRIKAVVRETDVRGQAHKRGAGGRFVKAVTRITPGRVETRIFDAGGKRISRTMAREIIVNTRKLLEAEGKQRRTN